MIRNVQIRSNCNVIGPTIRRGDVLRKDGSNSEVVEEELTIRNESINIHEGDDIDGSWF